MHRFLPLLMILAITGCKSIEVGTGDIQLSARVSHSLDRYLTQSSNPAGFAVTADGEHHAAMSCRSASLCHGNWRTYLQRFCERDSEGQTCFILAERKKIVWKGQVTKHSGLDLNKTDEVVTYVQPRRVETRGPENSTGIILYLPGSAGTDREAPRDNATIPTYLLSLNDMGWDVLRGNVANSFRNDRSRANYMATADLTRKLRDLRKQGYAKIVVAGQSVGGAEALELVKRDDAEIDGIISAVPGCCGRPKNQDGTPNERFEQNWTFYNKLISDMRSDRRVAVAFFSGDEFEPHDRKEVSEQQFTAQNVPNFIIHQPDGILGHSGSWHTAFSFRYAKCLDDFLTTEEVFTAYQCEQPKQTPDDYRWMARESDLMRSHARAIDGQELRERIPGLTLNMINRHGVLAEFRFHPTEPTIEMTIANREKTFEYKINGDLLCIEKQKCNRLYEWDEDTLIGVADGEIRIRGQLNKPSVSDKPHS